MYNFCIYTLYMKFLENLYRALIELVKRLQILFSKYSLKYINFFADTISFSHAHFTKLSLTLFQVFPRVQKRKFSWTGFLFSLAEF